MATEPEPMPTGQDVADYLGRGDDTALVTLASTQVGHMTNLVKSYTRGKGFIDGDGDFIDDEVAADVKSVIVAATARLVNNPEGVQAETIGGYAVTYGAGGHGWTLAEQFVLNGYRRRLA